MFLNAWLINTFRILRTKFESRASGIKLGDHHNYDTKNQIIILLVCDVVLMLFLHLLSTSSHQPDKETQTKIKLLNMCLTMNTPKMLLTLSGVIISSVLLYLNDKLSMNTKIITTQ
jgi:hypothetical protein